MARANKTRVGIIAQKRSICVAVIPFVEADILVDGSVYIQLPSRILIQHVMVNITTVSGTATATLDVLANGVVLVNEQSMTASGVADCTLVAAARYLASGGELVLKAGAVTPADGALIGEVTVAYMELDKTSGEYTRHLAA